MNKQITKSITDKTNIELQYNVLLNTKNNKNTPHYNIAYGEHMLNYNSSYSDTDVENWCYEYIEQTRDNGFSSNNEMSEEGNSVSDVERNINEDIHINGLSDDEHTFFS